MIELLEEYSNEYTKDELKVIKMTVENGQNLLSVTINMFFMFFTIAVSLVSILIGFYMDGPWSGRMPILVIIGYIIIGLFFYFYGQKRLSKKNMVINCFNILLNGYDDSAKS